MRDKTDRLRRHLADQLQPGEEVLAGVGLSLHGSAVASMSASASTAGDSAPSYRGGQPLDKAMAGAEKAGLRRWPHWFLVLTSQRLLVVRRSAFNRPKQTALSAPVGDVETLTVSAPNTVKLALADGRKIRFETPKHLKFLPPVYPQLPEVLAQAQGAQES